MIDFIFKAPLILGIIATVYILLNYRSLSKLGLIIGWFIIFTVFCELWGSYLSNLKVNNLFLVHVYTLGAFTFCGLFFYRLFRILKWYYFKKEYLLIGIVLIILNSIFIQDLSIFNTYSKTVSQLVLIVLSIMAYSLLTIKKYPYKDKESIKIFITAILLSSAMSMFIYLFSNEIVKIGGLNDIIWIIHAGINGLVQLLFIYGLYKQVNVTK